MINLVPIVIHSDKAATVEKEKKKTERLSVVYLRLYTA